MAKIVTGFIMPHAPFMCAAPERATDEQRDACSTAFETIRGRVDELEIDTIIVIGDDHYTLFDPGCLPQALIGIGDLQGPVEPWLGVPRAQIENNVPLASHILQYGRENGVDWAASKALTVDHSIYVPYHFAIKPNPQLKTIPIYISSGVSPLIPSRRSFAIGQSIARAVAAWDGPDRVAIFGTGGVSHWPGMAKMGQINEDWDRCIAEMTIAGDAEALMAMTDEEILEKAGNGGLEIKNWICAMGALGPCSGSLIEYQAVYGWVCGCLFAELTSLHEAQ